MYCLLNTRTSEKFSIGSDIEIALNKNKSVHFKCKMYAIKESGKIVFNCLKVKTVKGYIPMDGLIETGVYEILLVNKGKNNRSLYGEVALVYNECSKQSLRCNGKEIEKGSKISLVVSDENKKCKYNGIYEGVTDSNKVVLSSVVLYTELLIVGSTSKEELGHVTVEISNNANIEGMGNVEIK